MRKLLTKSLFLTLLIQPACTTTEPVDPKTLDIDLKKKEKATPEAKEQTSQKTEGAVPTRPPELDWRPLFKSAPTEKERSQLSEKVEEWRDADAPDVILKKARNEVALGQLTAAEASYRALLRLDPENLEGILELSQLYVKQFKLENSFEFLSQGRDIITRKGDVSQQLKFQYKYVLALSLLANGDKDKAHTILSDLIAADKSFTPGYATLAASYLKSGKPEAADFILQRGMDRGPEDPRLTNLMGVVEEQKGKTQDAKRWFQQTLEKHPTFVPALINRANLAVQEGAYDAAEQDLQKAINLAPDSVEAYIALGLLQKKLGRFAASENSFNKAIEINPESGHARYNLALLLMERLNKPNVALRLFHEVLQARESDDDLKDLAKLQIEGLKDSFTRG